MEANEPCLGRWVHDDASGLEGLVIEVKTGGWRVVVDPAPKARLVRLHGVGRRREARHLVVGYMAREEPRRRR